MTGSSNASARGLIVAAPASGSGKTVFTLALLRHLAAQGVRAASAKAGPDYIDPAFHAAATRRVCLNLDIWAMRPATIAAAVHDLGAEADVVVCEGVMGLFDGATVDAGSTADLAALSGWPVVLVVDAHAQAASAAALIQGFARHRADVHVAACVFNRTGSDSHKRILGDACALAVPEVPVLGCIGRDAALELPERHLGLVQAAEHDRLEAFLDAAARRLAADVDIDALLALARPWRDPGAGVPAPPPVPPIGQRIAIASDEAFAFAYPHLLAGWRAAGADVVPFSPLVDEAPDETATAVYLPGGYPELHAGRLAANGTFLTGLAAAAGRGAAVFGECGGYMVLGQGLIDGDGARHAMAGLLPLETSFAERRLHLGYRRARLAGDAPLGAAEVCYRGHEFHYAKIVDEGPGAPLFRCADAVGRDLGPAGRMQGSVMGSFIHLIDREGHG